MSHKGQNLTNMNPIVLVRYKRAWQLTERVRERAVTDLFPDVLTSISNVEQDWTMVRQKEFGDLLAFFQTYFCHLKLSTFSKRLF